MDESPRREISEEERKVVEARKQSDVDRQKQKDRIQKNEKIRCPCCKKNMYFDQYLSNKQVGCLLCPNCGVLFIDKAKLKIIKNNISEAKQRGLSKIIKTPPADSPISILSEKGRAR